MQYQPRATCADFLEPLASMDDPDQFLVVGDPAQCPDCGRMWRVEETVTWGSPVQVEWRCTEPPPADWTPTEPAPDQEAT